MRIWTSPVFKSCKACSRSHCSLSPWILWHFTPFSMRSEAMSSVTLFLLQNTITLSSGSIPARNWSSYGLSKKKNEFSIRLQRMEHLRVFKSRQFTRSLRSSSSTISILWLTEWTAVKSRDPTTTWTGLLEYCETSLLTPLGHVALVMIDCLSDRIFNKIFRICTSKPISNILSASSNTTYVTDSNRIWSTTKEM